MKYNEDGSINKYKARLVAQGYNQIKGVDYLDSYSPVIHKKTMRILLALSVENDWEMHHVDVTSSYLNGDIQETVFVEQPKMFEKPGTTRKEQVCILKKNIYGLHQAGKNWNDCINQILLSFGLQQSTNDPCVFFKEDLFVRLYVDDLAITGSISEIEWFKKKLSEKLTTKDLNKVKHFLGVQIKRNNNGTLQICQESYIQQLLEEYKMEEAKGCSSPQIRRTPRDGEDKPFDNYQYRRLIRYLLYIANNSRPDLSFIVSKLSKYCSNPTYGNWIDAKNVLRYLKQTCDAKLTYEKTNNPIITYVDADWGNEEDGKSIGGYVILLANGPIIWTSRKQELIATSTSEAEYIAMFEVCKEMAWLREFFEEIGQSKYLPRPTIIYEDNQCAIQLSNKMGITERTKHIRLRYHKIREFVKNKEVEFKYISSSENCADILTKVLSGPKTMYFLKKMNFEF